MANQDNAPLRIGVAGLGTVGGGVLKAIDAQREQLSLRAGRPLKITAVSARNRSKDRGVDLSGIDWEDDAVALARRPDIDVVVEVIGGSDGPAKATTEATLQRGAHVVTANKAMMAIHGAALAELAEANSATLRFEAAVAGGVPIVKALSEGLAANRMRRVYGVLNGTCNYMLTEMEHTGRDYQEILIAAQELGYAEADPSADVGGWDAAHKLSLLAALAFGARVDFEGVAVEGIERVALDDLKFARDLGYRVKLIASALMTENGLLQRVAPCLVAADSAIGGLDGVTNAVVCEGDAIGQTVYEGPGAGEGPTASAIVADILDIAPRRPYAGVRSTSGDAGRRKPRVSRRIPRLLLPEAEFDRSTRRAWQGDHRARRLRRLHRPHASTRPQARRRHGADRHPRDRRPRSAPSSAEHRRDVGLAGAAGRPANRVTLDPLAPTH